MEIQFRIVTCPSQDVKNIGHQCRQKLYFGDVTPCQIYFSHAIIALFFPC